MHAPPPAPHGRPADPHAARPCPGTRAATASATARAVAAAVLTVAALVTAANAVPARAADTPPPAPTAAYPHSRP